MNPVPIRLFEFAVAVVGWSFIASSTAAEGLPRCAFLSEGRTPVVELLEAELLSGGKGEWLERAEIDKVFTEQKVQALLSPEGSSERASLGKILKADVLVVVKQSEIKSEGQPPTRRADVVVAETKSGVRLLRRSAPMTESAEADAKTLSSFVEEGIAKQAQPIARIYAVPPFVSRDLTYEFDYLKAAYARLMEESLLDQPGTVVVELAEAEAIARESQVAARDDTVKRGLPWYVLGEYRNDGRGDERKMTISLSLKQGAREVAKANETVAPDSAAKFLLESLATFSKSAGGPAAAAAPDPATESKQLAERGDEFFRYGMWNEALSLYEAALLLGAKEPAIRRSAAAAAKLEANGLDQNRAESLKTVYQLSHRSFEHLMALAQSAPVESIGDGSLIFRDRPMDSLAAWNAGEAIPEELRELYADYRTAYSAFAARMADRFAEAGDLIRSAALFTEATRYDEPSKQYERRMQMILRHQKFQFPAEMIAAYGDIRQPRQVASYEHRKFLEQLRDAPEATAAYRAAATELLASFPLQDAAAIGAGPAPNASKGAGPSRLSFSLIDLGTQKLRGTESRLPFQNCLALSTGADVWWLGSYVFVMKDRDRPTLTWQARTQNSSITSLTFDGKYLWLTATMDETPPEVWVLDPETGEKWEITREHGLPLLAPSEIPGPLNQKTPRIHGAAIAEGEAIIAGKSGRSWMAHVKFDREGKHACNVFFEAKKVVLDVANVDANDVGMTFSPAYMVALRDPKGAPAAKPSVVVGREEGLMIERPLLVDTNKLSVAILAENGAWPMLGAARSATTAPFPAHLYGVRPENLEGVFGLIEFSAPFQPRFALSNVNRGQVVFDEQHINIAGREWVRGAWPNPRFESFGPVPWKFTDNWYPPLPAAGGDDSSIELLSLMRSNHYGLVATCGRKGSKETVMAKVHFDGSGRPLGELFDRAARGGSAADVAARPSTIVRSGAPPRVSKLLWDDSAAVMHVSWSPDGERVLTRGRRGGLSLWDGRSGAMVGKLETGPGALTVSGFSRSGHYIVAGAENGAVTVWKTDTLEKIGDVAAKKAVVAFDVSSDDRLLAFATRRGVVTLFDLAENASAAEFSLPEGVERLTFTPDNANLVLTSSTQPASVWDIGKRARVARIESIEQFIGFQPDQTLLGACVRSNTLISWNLANASPRTVWEDMPGLPYGVSRDGRWLATFEREVFIDGERREPHRIRIWDLITRKELLHYDGGVGESVAFSPDGKTVLIAGSRGVKRFELPMASKAASFKN